MDTKLRTILTELRSLLEGLYGDRLVRLVLFGSQARGDAGPDSDIDILVVLNGTVDPGEEISRTGELVSQLSLKHDSVVLCSFTGLEQFLNRQEPLLRNIRREGVLV